MTMRVVRPLAITDAMLLYSSVDEDDTPAWGVGTTYAADARRHLVSTHRVYQSLQDSNVGNDPETSVGYWADGGPTNRWAMFDNIAETVTTSDSAIVVRLQPGPISSIALLRLQGYSVRVVMRDAVGGATVYDRTVSLEAVPIIDWYTWTVAPFRYRQSMVLTDLPLYPVGELEVTIAPITGLAVQCGVFVIGTYDDIGDPQKGISLGGIDYSKVTTDEYGSTSIVRRSASNQLDFETIIDEAELEYVTYTLSDVRATPCVWVPTLKSTQTALTLWGLIEDWKAGIAKDNLIRITGRIRGLT